MNIELKVDGLEFKGTINKENTEAQSMFSNLLSGVFGQPIVTKIVPVEEPQAKIIEEPKEDTYTFQDAVKLAQELAQDMAQDIVSDINSKATKQFTNDSCIIKDDDSLKDLGYSLTRREPTGKRKLLVGTCDCGEKHFIWIYDNGKEHTFKCRKCEKEHTADYHKLVKANIVCSNCGYKAYAFLNGKEQTEVRCKQCDSPIDLIYHEAHKCMESL